MCLPSQAGLHSFDYVQQRFLGREDQNVPLNDIIFKQLENLKTPSINSQKYLTLTLQSGAQSVFVTLSDYFWHRTTKYVAAHIMFIVVQYAGFRY
jgi:hypothetical protein